MEWKRLGTEEFYKLYDDYLPLGPLQRLKLTTNRILEMYLHGKPANSKQVDLTMLDANSNEEWKKREKEKEEEAVRLKDIDKKAEEDRILQNEQRQQVQKKRKEKEKKELEEALEEEERVKREKDLKLRKQAILMLSEELEEVEVVQEEDWVDFDPDIHLDAGDLLESCAVLCSTVAVPCNLMLRSVS
jgi:hypothetical protein